MHSERNRTLGEVNINLVAQQTNLLLFQCIIFYFSFKFRRALFGWCLSWGRMMEDDFVRKLSQPMIKLNVKIFVDVDLHDLSMSFSNF